MKHKTNKTKKKKVGHTSRSVVLKHKCTVSFHERDAAKIKKVATVTGVSVSGLMRSAILKALINQTNKFS